MVSLCWKSVIHRRKIVKFLRKLHTKCNFKKLALRESYTESYIIKIRIYDYLYYICNFVTLFLYIVFNIYRL
nr:MAG TPA: hypothetical protein [Caudoviricetes sp.]